MYAFLYNIKALFSFNNNGFVNSLFATYIVLVNKILLYTTNIKSMDINVIMSIV